MIVNLNFYMRIFKMPQKKLVLDGVKVELIQPDLDGDGVVGGTEKIQFRRDTGKTDIIQPTELGETLGQLNKDTLEENRMSGIDMRSRLHYIEISYVLALDALVGMGVIPTRCLALARQKKRLSVSLNGRGREEIVRLVVGKREQDVQRMGGFGDRVKNFFGGGGQSQK